MTKKVLSSLILFGFLLTTGYTPVQAALKEGKFTPGVARSIPASNQKSKNYQIKPGDTLWDISRSHDVDLQTVLAINGLRPDSILTIGDTIQLPADNARQHLIKKGETMWGIAALYNIDVEELNQLNRDKNPENLRIGDKLIIPESTVRVVAVMAEPSRGFQNTVYAWPLSGAITSYYGWRKSGFHHGLDIAAEIGTPVKAAASGEVCFAGTRNIYGKTIIIEHADMKQTLYAHLSKLNADNGQEVRKGQVIGYVGVTGRTTGPHLHFAVIKDEETLDPLEFLRK